MGNSVTDSISADRLLKPCPFCGTVPQISRQHSQHTAGVAEFLIGCDHPDCLVYTVAGPCPTQAEVVSQWNRRGENL